MLFPFVLNWSFAFLRRFVLAQSHDGEVEEQITKLKLGVMESSLMAFIILQAWTLFKQSWYCSIFLLSNLPQASDVCQILHSTNLHFPIMQGLPLEKYCPIFGIPLWGANARACKRKVAWARASIFLDSL